MLPARTTSRTGFKSSARAHRWIEAKHHTRWLNAMDDSKVRYLYGPSQDVDTDTPATLIDTVASR
ncbi:hypothetical protein NFJ07_25180, partial [Arthrobacter sp. B2a2-09]|uniref:hypothetical protein n=1 Tax=Arthrobacter sp. B2a2-09 TaxID=2952822 RepID=UPI0022CD3B1E